MPEEPFRLFFPLGLVAGFLGVGLWLRFFLVDGIPFPGVSHARIMLHGFVAAFVFGFLSTAGPRMLEVQRFRVVELVALAGFWAGSLLAHLGGWHATGDACFLAAVASGFLAAARRWPQRRDLPPSGFVLVLLGLAAGIAGTLALLIAPRLDDPSSAIRLHTLGRLFLYHAFPLLPIAGIAPFFLGRFFGAPHKDAQPGIRNPNTQYLKSMILPLAAGLGLLASWILEAWESPLAATALRAPLLALLLVSAIPWRLSGPEPRTLARWIRVALALLFIGSILPLLMPRTFAVAGYHIWLIGGANLIIFAVAAWVTRAHAGRRDEISGGVPFFHAIGILLMVALAARFGADAIPAAYNPHLILASLLWLSASVLWLIRLTPSWMTEDPED